MRSYQIGLLALLPLIACGCGGPNTDNALGVDYSYITDNYIAAAFIRPKTLLASDMAKGVDFEKFSSEVQLKYDGFDWNEQEWVLALADKRAFDSPDYAAFIGRSSTPIDPQKFFKILGAEGVQKEPGKSYYVLDTHAVFFPDDYTYMILLQDSLPQSSSGELSQLAQRIDGLDLSQDLVVTAMLESVKSDLSQKSAALKRMPGPMAGLANLAQQISAVTLSADLDGSNLLRLEMETYTEEDAKGLKGLLDGFIGMGKGFLSQAPPPTPLDADTAKEATDMARKVVEGTRVETPSTTKVTVEIPRPEGFNTLMKKLADEAQKAQQSQEANL